MKETFKKYLKGSPKQEKLPEPRRKEAIMTEYTDLAGRLGQAYYRRQVLEADLAEFTSRIAKLDLEMRARTALDEQTTKETKEKENGQA